MKRTLPMVALLVGLAATASAAPGRRGGGGWHRPPSHHHFRGSGGFGGAFFWDPFFVPSYYYPYYFPYAVYPPPEDIGWDAPPTGEPGDAPEAAPDRAATDDRAADDAAQRATYGLVQLRGVPDGAAVDLDGRFWLTATQLDNRWLALPEGSHRVTIRVVDADPVEQRIDVAAGKTRVIRLPPIPRTKG